MQYATAMGCSHCSCFDLRALPVRLGNAVVDHSLLKGGAVMVEPNVLHTYVAAMSGIEETAVKSLLLATTLTTLARVFAKDIASTFRAIRKALREDDD
jgi:hypothetical protein